MTGPHVTVVPDPPLPRGAVTEVCHEIVDEHERWRTRVGTFRDLLPAGRRVGPRDVEGRAVRARSASPRASAVELVLADASPHALVGGPSGSGKTNLLLTMIASLAARYSPDELELYLLDFKEGVSFAQFAPGRRDPTLAAARAPDRRQHQRPTASSGSRCCSTSPTRCAAAPRPPRTYEVTKLEELRGVDPDGHWPRIVAVIDEFQFLFAERDAVTRDGGPAAGGRRAPRPVARASTSCWPARTSPASRRSGAVRRSSSSSCCGSALPRARRVLAERNDATAAPAALARRAQPRVRHHARQPDRPDPRRHRQGLGGRGAAQDLRARVGRAAVPRLFDGSRAPRARRADLRAAPGGRSRREAIVGQCIDVAGSAAAVPLPAAPGRNIGVVGTARDDAVAVLGAPRASLGMQHELGEGRFVLAPLVADAAAAARALRRRLAGHDVAIVRLDGFRARRGARREVARLAGAGPVAGLPGAVRGRRRGHGAGAAAAPRRCGRCCASARRPACTRSAGGAARNGCRTLLR